MSVSAAIARAPVVLRSLAANNSSPGIWLISRRADFWLACGGASAGLLAAALLIAIHGDREMDWLDFVLSEFHLGATYDAVLRRRLWNDRPREVLAIPLLIVALIYSLWFSGHTMLLTSVAMYAAVWHRGRQSFGVARYYQRQVGGPVTPVHELLFRGAIYLPMLAGLLAYCHLAPSDYEGKPYFALNLGAQMVWVVGVSAVICVIGYQLWTCSPRWARAIGGMTTGSGSIVHPGERWVVLTHAVAFASGYFLGAANVSFMLVLAVHHEVQYLFFTYAMADRLSDAPNPSRVGMASATADLSWSRARQKGTARALDLTRASSFFIWPVIGFIGAVVGGWSELAWLEPLGIGGLFCHYWLDGRIWTRESFQN